MKTLILACALFASTGAGFAHAAEPVADSGNAVAQSQQWTATLSVIASKTRSDVRQELVNAEHDGRLAHRNSSLYRGS